MSFRLLGPKPALLCALSVIPLSTVLLAIFGPILADSTYLYSGIGIGLRPGVLPGYPTIDPTVGQISHALGMRAALEVLAGRLPLWNYYEGLGAPLLGEMQSAALFPPTWLLALPHGQALEHALLQFVAGAGAFMFFRKVGLRTGAALAGALIFEVNGVFAWLRNAVFNPVAFLPWLFFAVEGLRCNATAERAITERLPMICIGAVMAALAVYAGFPEQVYLYSLLLFAWVAFRMAGLSRRQNLSFATDLVLTGVVSIALASPLLVAFFDFLPDAELGTHGSSEGGWLDRAALIQYLTPYIYGPIFASADPRVSGIWANIGGYVGFGPLVMAFAALLVPGRRAIKIFLSSAIVLILGITHGAALIYPAFMALPLSKMVAGERYFNISWIFCVVFLAVMFIDGIPTLTRAALRRAVGRGVICALLCAAGAAAFAWPLLRGLWSTSFTDRPFLTGALVAVIVVSLGILAIARYGKAQGAAVAFSAILVAEMLTWFFFPFLSYPRGGRLDHDLIAFLRANIGYQRIVNTAEAALAANYGSYFRIPSLNYQDLPALKITSNYIKANLDPYADAILFTPTFPGLPPEQEMDRRKQFHERLHAYARAGVKYLLAGPYFNSTPAFDVLASGNEPLVMAAGQRLEISARWRSAGAEIAAASVLIGTLSNTSSGRLAMTLCAGETCANGAAELDRAEDNKPLRIAFDRPVKLEEGAAYTVRIEKLGGDKPVAVWMFPLASAELATKIVAAPGRVKDGYLPDLRLVSRSDVVPTYVGRSMSVYELPATRDYFSAEACSLKPLSRSRLDASCTHPSKLVRLEASMRGWSAAVEGKPVPVGTTEDVFQTIDLPAGDSRIEFFYAPRGFKPALAAAGAALVVILAVFAATLAGMLAPALRQPASR